MNTLLIAAVFYISPLLQGKTPQLLYRLVFDPTPVETWKLVWLI